MSSVSTRARTGLQVALGLLLALQASRSARGDDGHETEAAALDDILGTTGSPLPALTGDRVVDAAHVRTFIQERMAEPAFYDAVLPRLFTVFSKSLWSGEFRSGLSVARIGGRDVWFDPDAHADAKHPCAARDQSRVVPWWNGKTKIWVCNSDYRPDVTMGEKFPHVMAHCEVDAHPGSECRCGPHLLYCAPTKLMDAIDAAILQEPRLTARYVIEHHMPFSKVLTMNESVRPGMLDIIYGRGIAGEHTALLTGGDAELLRVALRPRPKQYTGGVLTTVVGTAWDISHRNVGRVAWDDFLCMPLIAARTHAAPMFDLPNANLRMQGQDRLTQMPGCKECHRRLEGITHAFADFLPPTLGHRWQPNNPPDATMSFYGRDSRDLRAEGPAEPLFIGETLVKQPEFPACVARRVEQLFFGGEPIPPTADRMLSTRFAEGFDFAKLVEDAAVLRVLGPEAVEVGATQVSVP